MAWRVGSLAGLMTSCPGAGHVVITLDGDGRRQKVASSWARRAAASVVGAWQA